MLARRADLTLFDEPEAGIDLWSFDNLIELFKTIRQSIIIVSHQDRLLKSANRVLLLQNGEIAQGDSVEGLKCDRCGFARGDE